jgi:hypothetical protein
MGRIYRRYAIVSEADHREAAKKTEWHSFFCIVDPVALETRSATM